MSDPSKDLRKKILGRRGEDAACKYLKKHGYKIVKRNYKTPVGEADIIAYKGGVYAFVEVKARAGDAFGLPSEAVTREKQRRYHAIAAFFCLSQGEELPVRFDVASVLEGDVEYIENAYL